VSCVNLATVLADVDMEVVTVLPKKRIFKKFSYMGVDLDGLMYKCHCRREEPLLFCCYKRGGVIAK